MPTYVVITPVRNEAAHVEKTLASMAAQTVRPMEWIIVDDASTDATAQIVAGYAGRCEWIRLVDRADRGFRQRGTGVVDAFYDGLARVTRTDYDVVVKLDGDLSFGPEYFERLLSAFDRNPRLGIAGGLIYVQKKSRWTTERFLTPWTSGPSKVYRRACFEAIGGLRRHLGWDGVDNWQAMMLGWEIGRDKSLAIYHHRPPGRATGSLAGRVEEGRGAYYMGYHPLFMLVRSVWRMRDRPLLLAGGAMLWGYLKSWLTRSEQVEPELVHFVQRTQLRVLKSLLLQRRAMDY